MVCIVCVEGVWCVDSVFSVYVCWLCVGSVCGVFGSVCGVLTVCREGMVCWQCVQCVWRVGSVFSVCGVLAVCW